MNPGFKQGQPRRTTYSIEALKMVTLIKATRVKKKKKDSARGLLIAQGKHSFEISTDV